MQAIGSSSTYGKRYNTVNILNLRTHDEDDDGRAGGANDAGEPRISDEQATTIINKLEEVGCPKDHFLKMAGADMVGAIPASKYARAIAFLDEYKRRKGDKQ